MSGQMDEVNRALTLAAELADTQAFEADKEIGRLRLWLEAIVATGCFVVSGDKRTHTIPNPTCKGCMAARALKGDAVPKEAV